MLLSNNDIKRELIKAKNIAIHPLSLDKIRGSSINMTASNMAWRVSDKQSAVAGNVIKIPANDTVCIYTQEAIWISRNIGGTYHPRVSLVSKGLAHISTTLDPAWAGLSLVAVNNPTDREIEIRVGENFITIMLYYLKTASDLNIIDNAASRSDIARGFTLSHDEDLFLQEQWHRTSHGIEEKMLNSQNYKDLYRDKTKFQRGFREILSNPLVSSIVGGILTGIVIFLLGMN
ncbi:dCTP deaminase domain-containing protein [Bacillus wiedmannii]